MKLKLKVDIDAWVGHMQKKFIMEIVSRYPDLPREDVQDIAQDAAYDLCRAIRERDGEIEKPERWDKGILNLTIKAHFRKKSKHEDTISIEDLDNNQPQSPALDEDQEQLLEDAIHHLSEDHQEMVRLRKEGYKSHQMAVILQKPAGAIRKEITRNR